METIPLLITALTALGSFQTTLGATQAPAATQAPRPLTTASTLAPVTVFGSNHDRDNFIMQLNTDVLDIKHMLTSIYDKLNHLPANPSGSGILSPSGFIAFMVRLANRLSGLGQDQIIRFDDVMLNKGNGYDVRLGVFRCPLAGTYQFSLDIGSYGGIQLEIVNNGQQIGRVFTSLSRFGRDVDDEEEDDIFKREAGSTMAKSYNSMTTPVGVTAPAIGYVQPGSEATPGSAQAIVDLKVGDEVWVRHSSDNPHDVLFGSGMTTFSGHLLNPGRK